MKRIIGIVVTIVICLLVAIGITIGVEYYENQKIHYEEKEITLDVKQKIFINSDIANVKIIPSNEDKVTVNYYMSKHLSYIFTQIEDTLQIDSTFSNYWFSSATLKKEHFDLIITTPCVDLDIAITTGSVTYENYTTDTVTISGSTLDMNISNSISNNVTLRTVTGDITLDNCDFTELNIKGTTTDLIMDELRGHLLLIEIGTGNIHLGILDFATYNISGKSSDITFKGKVEKELQIAVNTGDIKVSLEGDKSMYSLSGRTTVGNINFNESTDGDIKVSLKSMTGNLTIDFYS